MTGPGPPSATRTCPPSSRASSCSVFGSNFGASIVKGFAITLFLGVLISMFTAVIVTHTLLRAVTRLVRRKTAQPALADGGVACSTLSKNASGFTCFRSAVIVLGVVAMIYSTVTFGTPVRLSIDFTGGSLFVLQFNGPTTEDAHSQRVGRDSAKATRSFSAWAGRKTIPGKCAPALWKPKRSTRSRPRSATLLRRWTPTARRSTTSTRPSAAR